jgi:PAS domain S-box-containing protein
MSAGHETIHGRIFASLRDGVLAIDAQDRIAIVNQAARQLLGVDDDPAGRTIAEVFLADPDKDAFIDLVMKAVYDPSVEHDAELAMSIGGRRRDLHVRTMRLQGDELGRGIVVVLTDVTDRRKRRKLQALFQSYLDPRIVELVSAGDAEGTSLGQRQVMTVLFCDLVGSSAIAERLDPRALVEFMNAFLAAMSEPVAAQEGIVDKYVGDSVMAFWGPPFTAAATQADHACQAALAQRARLPVLAREVEVLLGTEAARALDVRIGVATGEVIVGSIGPSEARAFTVIGDTVNIAARLETASKEYGTGLLVSETTRRMAGPDLAFREVDSISLRGRAQPERVFELLGPTDEIEAWRRRLAATYEEALTAYRARNWAAARAGFDACLAIAPRDGPSTLMRARISFSEPLMPAGTWDGVWRNANPG